MVIERVEVDVASVKINVLLVSSAVSSCMVVSANVDSSSADVD